MDIKHILKIIDAADAAVAQPTVITESSTELSKYMDIINEEREQEVEEKFKFRHTGNRSSFNKHMKQTHGIKNGIWKSSKQGAKKFLLQDSNPVDTVTVDIPLLIRLLEYAKEDAQTDMDLHNVAEKMIEFGKDGNTLTMDNYDSIVGDQEMLPNPDDTDLDIE